eukprot:TRINITY_DN32415_c0_g1_i2.p1 TRINITY_DN32415_c0_g1~~TRINITY_DN32415_c0_g1_i2.p1  ORF type:complete len:181 (-),score=14.85 TRINITY_DN32415_c0_g1_i2:147-689(-)
MFSLFVFFLMIRRPPRSTLSSSSAASDVYKRQVRSYGFLQQCSCLSTISLQPFEGVSAIPHAFLTQCSFLREIDLTPLLLQPQQHPPPSSSLPITPMTTTSVLLLHRVHSNCLSYCTRLKTINLSALRNVVQIGDNFLFGSLSLSEIDLKALGNVEVIGKRFLGDCVGCLLYTSPSPRDS